MKLLIVAVFYCYCFIGLGVVLVGPVRRAIDRAIVNAHGERLANTLTGRKAPSEGKLLAFSFVAALMWPWLLVSALREEAREAKERKKRQKERGP